MTANLIGNAISPHVNIGSKDPDNGTCAKYSAAFVYIL